jgi:hypothetical protein
MGRKERAATGGYRAGPDSMWTCRASPAYEANRTPSSVPTGIPRSDLLGHISAWDIVDILVLTVFSNPIMRKPYLLFLMTLLPVSYAEIRTTITDRNAGYAGLTLGAIWLEGEALT